MSVPIPEGAIDEAAEAIRNRCAHDEFYDTAELAVRAAAPLIVAAELERLIDALKSDFPGDGPRSEGVNYGLRVARRALQGRASVLRGEGQTHD